MLDNIDNCLKKHNFSTRTEFIRDAIREKLEEMTKDELIHRFLELRGKGKKISQKQYRETRETVAKEILDDSRKDIKEKAFKQFLKEKDRD